MKQNYVCQELISIILDLVAENNAKQISLKFP